MATDRNAQARAQFSQKMGGGLLRQDAQAEEVPLTPQEEKLLKDAVQVAGQMLYTEQVARSVASLIAEPPHVEGIGEAAAQLTSKVDDQMNLPEDLIVPLGMLVAELVSDLGEELGYYKESDKFVKQCVQHTLKKLYEIYGTDEDELAAETEGYSPEELRSGMPAEEEMMGEPPAEAEQAPPAEEQTE